MGKGNTLFIGNIPYDVPEEQVVSIFSQCGPVKAFRLVSDKETGKPKGFGFLEYHDAETAASAVRNLANFEVNGRTLRVDYAENDAASANNDRSSRTGRQTGGRQPQQQQQTNYPPQQGYGMQGGYGMPMQHQMPSMQMNYGVQQAPAMGALGAGASGPVPYDAIASVLNTMNPNELLNVLSDMKDQIEKDPEQAKDFLQKNPQLCNALFQACIILKVVNPNVVQRVVQKIQESAMQQPPTQPIQPAAPMMGYGNVPPPGAGPMLPDLSHIPEPQRSALFQVLQMTPDQIAVLPPDQQQQIMLVRSQFGF